MNKLRATTNARAYFLTLLLGTWLGGSAAAQSTAGNAPVPLSAGARVRWNAQKAALVQEKAALTSAQRKIASTLRHAATEAATAGKAVAGAPKLRSNAVLEADGRVRVKMKADVTPALLAYVKALGGTVTGSYPAYRAVYAALPLASLEILAARDDVEFIGLPPTVDYNRSLKKPAAASRQSAVPPADTPVNDPEGDATHGANTVRTQYGATGRGIKVGVISDTLDNAQGAYQNALLNGYVPTVSPVPGQAGDSAAGEAEGLAMLEVVHRLVPDASLFFATANNGEEQMALNINALVADGCNVIIDDIFYSDESPFQDDAVAQAINAASTKGVLYFSCAANYGNQDSGTSSCWEGDFKGSAEDPTVLDFQPGGTNGPQELNYAANTGGNNMRVVLFWSEPLGGATSSYTLYELDGNGDVIQSADTNGKDPSQTLDNVSSGDYVAVVKNSGSDRFLHLDIASQGSALQFSTAGRIRGHDGCGAANAFCVAATPAAAAQTSDSPAGPYPSLFSSGNKVETFSNDGPRRIFFNPDGSAITPGNFSSTGGRLLAKPDFTAADGVSTSLPLNMGLNPFFGTSCAAPHAGALAALLLSYRPDLTLAQAGAALRGGAVQITNPGAGNRDSGAGILLAPNIFQVVNTPPSIITFSPANGPAGTIVTVTGINLGTAVSAAVNGVTAPLAVVNSNALTVTIPAGATTGRITVLTAGGAAGSASNFTLTASVSTPVISSAAMAGGQVGSAFSYQTTATNGPTGFGATGLPAGLSIDPGTGLISGTPAASGAFTVIITAGNAAGGSSAAALVLTILPAAPVLTSAASASGQVGVAFGFQIVAANAPASYSATGLPAGLSLDPASGLISGAPMAAGTFAAAVSATNAGGTGSQALLVSVLPAAPVLTSAATAPGQVGVAFGFQAAAMNGPANYGAAGLPAGLSINPASGLISGTPTAAGVFTAAVSATNAGGTGSQTLLISILPAPPVITSAPTAGGQQSQAFSYAITASNAPTGFAAAGLPAGLSLDAATGVVSGVPSAAGTATVTVSAANAGGTGTATLTLVIAALPPSVSFVIAGGDGSKNASVAEGGPKLKILVTRSGTNFSQPLTVLYKAAGDAAPGQDYKSLTGIATIPAGAANTKIQVRTYDDGVTDGTKSLKLKLKPATDGSYTLGELPKVKVTILDVETTP